MHDWNIRGIASVQLLVGLASEHGISPAKCLHGSAIPVASLDDPLYEIEASQELVVIRNFLHFFDHVPGIGLEVGWRYRLTGYGILGYAMLSSRTLGSAVELAIRNLDLTFAFNRFQVTNVPEGLLITLDDSDVPADCRQFLVERDATAVAALCGQMLSKPVPVRLVSFRFKRPAYAKCFEEFFNGPVSFGRPANGILLSAECAKQPLPLADEGTVRLCEEQCREILNRRQVRVRMSERVRQRLLRPGGGYEMDHVAAALGMAPRTLRRHLGAEGTSFRQLVDEVRQTLAEEMLEHRMTVEEVAERLGYAEGSSFNHAFKRWKGVSPRTHRRQTFSI